MKWHTLTHLGLLGAAAVAAHASVPAPARACSGSSCSEGSFHLEAGATIPANTPALLWSRPQSYGRDPQPERTPHVTRIDGDSEVEVPFELELGPGDDTLWLSEDLVPGGRYRLWVETAGDDECPGVTVEIEAGEAATLPEQLGALEMSRPQRKDVTVATYSGSCDTKLPAVAARVDIALAREAEPWSALFQYTTRVDGEDWNPQWSLSGPGPYGFTGAQTLLFAECPGRPSGGRPLDDGAVHFGLSQGPHAVEVEASLPGVDRVLGTARAQLKLDCAASGGAAEPGSNLSRTYLDTNPDGGGSSDCSIGRYSVPAGTRRSRLPAITVVALALAALLVRFLRSRNVPATRRR